MATVKEITHDSSTTLSDFYTTITDPDGRITVTPGSALGGSTNGLNILFGVGNNADLVEPFTAISGNEIRCRARINIDNLTPLGASNIFHFRLRNSVGGRPFEIFVEGDGIGGIIIYARAAKDTGGTVNIGGVTTPVSSGDTCFELRAIRETADGNADGIAEFFAGNTLVGSLANIENFNVWAADGGMQDIRISYNSGVGHSGNLYYDEFILDDSASSSLGCVSGGSYVIGTAIDNEVAGDTAWLTLWRDNVMYLQRWDLPTLTNEFEISLGAATLTQVQTRSRVAYPFAGSDQTMWVFGNMLAPAFLTGTVHLMETTGAGASGTWANASVSLGSWASDDVLDSLFVSTDLDGLGSREFIAIRRQAGAAPELWKGLGGLSFISTIPLPTGSSVEYRGMHVGRNTEISVGSATLATGSSRIFSAISPYTTWTDKTFDFPSGTVEVLRYL